MAMLDPYIMPEYYWYEDDPQYWVPYPGYPPVDPSATEYSQENGDPWMYNSGALVPINKPYHGAGLQPVPVDLVMAANCMLNDFFGIISPDIHRTSRPRHKNGKVPTTNKKQTVTPPLKSRSPSPPTVKLVKPEISYNREELMNLSKSPMSQTTPPSWAAIAKKVPRLVRREGPTANILIKEVRAIRKQEEEKKSMVKIHNDKQG